MHTFRNLRLRRSLGALGFSGHGAHLASVRLIDAVVATLTLGSLSLSLAITIALLSTRVSMAMPG